MAQKNGCNSDMRQGNNMGGGKYYSFDATKRNNLSMGGRNKDLGGGAKNDYKQPVKAGGAAQGDHHYMPKGK